MKKKSGKIVRKARAKNNNNFDTMSEIMFLPLTPLGRFK